jgi:hypothetical protein
MLLERVLEALRVELALRVMVLLPVELALKGLKVI